MGVILPMTGAVAINVVNSETKIEMHAKYTNTDVPNRVGRGSRY